MFYLYSSLLALLLYFIELSLFPHFSPWLVVPFLLLPFIAILSVKDRTVFPIILGASMGLLLDANTLGQMPIFTISFLLFTTVSKLFFLRFVSYGELRASVALTFIGLTSIYIAEIVTQISTFKWSVSLLIPIIFNYILTFGILVLMIIGLRRYFDLVEKTTEERYR